MRMNTERLTPYEYWQYCKYGNYIPEQDVDETEDCIEPFVHITD